MKLTTTNTTTNTITTTITTSPTTTTTTITTTASSTNTVLTIVPHGTKNGNDFFYHHLTLATDQRDHRAVGVIKLGFLRVGG